MSSNPVGCSTWLARRRARCRSSGAADTLPTRTVSVEGSDDRPGQRRRVRRGHRAAVRRRRAADVPVRADVPRDDVAGHRFRLPLRRNGFGAHRKPDHAAPADRGDRRRRRERARAESARAPAGAASGRGHRGQGRQRRGVAAGRRRSCTNSGPACPTNQSRRTEEAAETAAAQRHPAHHPRPDPALRIGRRAITTRSTPTRSAPSCSASPPSSPTECSVPQRSWRTSRASCPTR